MCHLFVILFKHFNKTYDGILKTMSNNFRKTANITPVLINFFLNSFRLFRNLEIRFQNLLYSLLFY